LVTRLRLKYKQKRDHKLKWSLMCRCIRAGEGARLKLKLAQTEPHDRYGRH
jgi:hypothetical protein